MKLLLSEADIATQQQECIKYKAEVLKLMALFLVLVGGYRSLGLGTVVASQIVLMAGESALTAALALVISKLHQLIDRLIKKLEQ